MLHWLSEIHGLPVWHSLLSVPVEVPNRDPGKSTGSDDMQMRLHHDRILIAIIVGFTLFIGISTASSHGRCQVSFNAWG